MPRGKKQIDVKKALDAQTELYMAFEKAGWAPDGHDCLYANRIEGEGEKAITVRFRLNFTDKEVMRLERRVVRAREEMKQMATNIRAVWAVVDEAPYVNVVLQDNQPVFNK